MSPFPSSSLLGGLPPLLVSGVPFPSSPPSPPALVGRTLLRYLGFAWCPEVCPGQTRQTNPTDIPVAEPGIYMGCLGMGQACAGGSPHTKGGKPWVCLAPLTPENNKKIIIKK